MRISLQQARLVAGLPGVEQLDVCKKIRCQVSKLVGDLGCYQGRTVDQQTSNGLAHLGLVRVVRLLESKDDRSSLAHAGECDQSPESGLGHCWLVENLKEGLCRGKSPALIPHRDEGVRRTSSKLLALVPSDPGGQRPRESAEWKASHRGAKVSVPCGGFVLDPFYQVRKVVCAKLAQSRITLQLLVCRSRPDEGTKAISQEHAAVPRFGSAALLNRHQGGNEHQTSNNRQNGATLHPRDDCTEGCG